MILVRIGLIWLLAMLAGAMAGCASQPVLPHGTAQGVTLPPLPVWPAAASGDVTYHSLDVAMDLLQRMPEVKVQLADRAYTRVSHAWLVEYLDWTVRASAAAGIAYTAESFDCDDFALGFYFFATRAAAKAGVKAAPLMPRVVVEWAPGVDHELIGVATDRGEFIVEPQPNAALRMVPLAGYPKKILALTFGDASR